MSDELVNPLESPASADADGGPEASAPPAGSAGATERRRSRSGVEPADPAPAAPEARPASGFVGRHEPDDDDRSIADDDAQEGARDAAPSLPPLTRTRSRSPSLSKPVGKAEALRPEQRLLLLDTWLRSGRPAGDFAALVGLSKFTSRPRPAGERAVEWNVAPRHAEDARQPGARAIRSADEMWAGTKVLRCGNRALARSVNQCVRFPGAGKKIPAA